MFHHILIVDLVDVEEDFRGIISPDLKANIVLIVSNLPKPSIRYNISIEIRDIDYII